MFSFLLSSFKKRNNEQKSRRNFILVKCKSKVNITQSCPTPLSHVQLCDPMDSIIHGILQTRILEWVAFPFSREFSQPTQGSNPGLLQFQADSLPVEPQGKPRNTGVGSLSLPQQIFPTQESNGGFLCCRWILYQLS